MDRTEYLVTRTESQATPTKTYHSLHVDILQYPSYAARPATRTLVSSQKSEWQTIFGTYTSRTVSRRARQGICEAAAGCQNEVPLMYETTVRFIPSFGYKAFIWNTRAAYGSVERSLRTMVIDDRKSDLWRFCMNNDVESFQKAVSHGATPLIVDRWGSNLYHVSIIL